MAYFSGAVARARRSHHSTLSLAVSILRDENEGSRCNIEAEVQDVPKTDERETEWA